MNRMAEGGFALCRHFGDHSGGVSCTSWARISSGRLALGTQGQAGSQVGVKTAETQSVSHHIFS